MPFRSHHTFAAYLLALPFLLNDPASAQRHSPSSIASGDLQAPREALPSYQRTVVSGEFAYTVGSVEMVAGPRVIWASASPGGEVVLALRERTSGNGAITPSPDPLDVELFCWNQRTGRTASLWRYNLQREKIENVQGVWLTGSAKTVLTITRTVRSADAQESTETAALIVDIPTARARFVPIGSGQCLSLASHPTQALAAMVVWDIPGNKTTLRTVNGEGRLNSPLPIVPFTPGPTVFASVHWNGDALEVGGVEVSNTDGKTKSAIFSGRMDLTSGKLAATPGANKSVPSSTVKTPTLPLRLETERKSVDLPATGPVPALWLVADTSGDASEPYHERFRVTLDADRAWILANLKGILYFSQGGLYIAPISRTGRETFVAGRDAAVKRQMLANLKQIISAAEQYALDNKSFPAAGSDLSTLLTGPSNYLGTTPASVIP